MPTLIHRRVSAARNGVNPFVISRLSSGWVVIGDHQVVHGYLLLLPDPVVSDLNQLRLSERDCFLHDMGIIGDALIECTGCERVNYEILGNYEPALHAHLFPRYPSEPSDLRLRPIWFYDFDAAPKTDVNAPETRRFIEDMRAFFLR